MAPRQILIEWDWGATGIWWVSTPEERSAPARPGRWVFDAPLPDRRRAWRGQLSDDLIDALQAWNDRGEEVLGSDAHTHTDAERDAFYARGHELAVVTQQELGASYEVICPMPHPPAL